MDFDIPGKSQLTKRGLGHLDIEFHIHSPRRDLVADLLLLVFRQMVTFSTPS